MTAMFQRMSAPGMIPPRPVTIHKGDQAAVAFDGFGTVTVTGPRRTELAGMVAALPLILRQIVTITTVLRERDGAASPHVTELENALAEAGINPDGPFAEDIQPMTPVTPSTATERYALLLGTVADRLDTLLSDRKALHTTPHPIREALADIASVIRAALRENQTHNADQTDTVEAHHVP